MMIVGLIFLFVLTHQVVLLLCGRRFDIFRIETLIDVVLLVVFVYGPLANSDIGIFFEKNPGFGLTTLLGISGLYLGLHLLGLQREPTQRENADTAMIRSNWLWLGVMIHVILVGGMILQRVLSSGGNFWGYFMSERITAYAATLNELNRGDWFQSLSAATKPPVLLLLALSLDRHKWVQAIFLWVLLLSTALVIFVTRLEVVIIFALPIAYYHFRVRKLSAAISGMGFAAFLIIMLALNLWRGGGVSAIDKSELTFKNALSSVGTDLNTVRGYMRLWELYDVGQLPYDYGATYPYILLTPIPRALWNEKPLTSFESRWNVKLFGQQLPTVDGMTGVWIFTPWGEGLAQLGVFGVFLNLFLYGLMLSWIRRRIKGQSLFVLVWFYYSVNAATLLRGSFTSLFFLTCSYFASAVLFYMLANRRSPIHRWLVQNWSEMA